ncbi:hypothetical protein I4U23_011311 [Adineta vaga]|nr:hypothetical protein I4U23_011311 [Adineta vaga]
MHSVFRIEQIKQIEGYDRICQVDLTLTSDNDRELNALTECIREETQRSTGWLRLSQLMSCKNIQYEMGNTKLVLYLVLISGFLATCYTERYIKEDFKDISLANERRALLKNLLRAIVDKRNHGVRFGSGYFSRDNTCTFDGACCSGRCKVTSYYENGVSPREGACVDAVEEK